MKYLFYISKLYSIPVVQPLVSYLKTSYNTFAFYVSRKVKNQLPEEWAAYPVYCELEEAEGFKSDFVLCPGNFVDYRIPGIKVQLFHGLGIEKASHYQIRHFFDVYLTSGPHVTKRYNALQKKYGYFLVEETGWPKVDHILKYPAENLKKEMGIPKDKKVVLYAPTHSRKMQSAEALLPVIPGLIKDDEFWIMKFHELMSKDVIRSFMNGYNSNILFTDGYDITPYLHVSDVLISDTSSVLYEFMALDRPVITYQTSARTDKGIDIQDPNELRDALDRSLNNPKEFAGNRKRHLLEVNPCLDGHVSRHLFQVLKEIKQYDKLAGKKKPLNLFRKAQIHYHTIFRRGYLR